MVLLCSAAAAAAVTINGTFALSGNAYVDPGLVVQTSAQNGSFSLDLTSGQSTTFDLFDIWTDEKKVNGNNTRQRTLVADFVLSSFGASGSISGTSTGHNTVLTQYGSIDWTAPVTLNLNNGGRLTIALSDEIYNYGLLQLSSGVNWAATVQATAIYVAPGAVPLPASGLLLGAALLGGGAAIRRRKAKA